jgi:DNA-binding transcriptional MerR regulator
MKPGGGMYRSIGTTGSAGWLSIAAVGKELGVTLRALRFYEQCGLVVPKRESRRRLYHEDDVSRLRTILKLKSFGLSLRDIRDLLNAPGDGPYGLTVDMCKNLIDRLKDRLVACETALGFLRDLEANSLPADARSVRSSSGGGLPAEPSRCPG